MSDCQMCGGNGFVVDSRSTVGKRTCHSCFGTGNQRLPGGQHTLPLYGEQRPAPPPAPPYKRKLRLVQLPNGLYVNPLSVRSVEIFNGVSVTFEGGGSTHLTPEIGSNQSYESLRDQIVSLLTAEE